MLLGVPVIPGEREGGVAGGVYEGEVYDALDARRHCRIDGGDVLPHPVGSLACRDHEERLCPRQSLQHRLRIVVRGFGGLCFWKVGSAASVANDESLAMT